jgi:hypothetical protein
VLTKSTFVGVISSEAYYYKNYCTSTFTKIVVLVTTIVAIGHYKRLALFCTHIRPFSKKGKELTLTYTPKPNHQKVTKKAIKFDNNDKWVHDG